ncbi:DUF2797 domain-containing protein [Streptomyces spectabilis]|uniref:DUF2797 domain-containing protein n=2 Tax=Streptomyces spectabilis TaxID=68270 RepID=A0A7W8AT08_STRST|nr:DUF2797 domain-containing protein [Streptomyces spectabilis]MBB5104056.1 hypothetical protein [Streptomyces spectabilis]MCI3903710.1 DUF2797 domain-containing protein [Streptomyces spectabilis]
MLVRMTWWCTGVRWHPEGGPALGWYAAGREPRESALAYGAALAFRARGGRVCLGVWRGGRRTPCPAGAGVAGRGTRGQCEECARVDRAHSVAADTFADDPRPYHVYVAWFGPGVVKVGITGVARGGTRLLEQGALAYSWLGRGPLMAARRTEELLRTALGVPDRIPYARKRALRARLPSPAERARELAELHRTASGLGGWPDSLDRLPYACVDHAGAFGLAGEPAEVTGVVSELVDGGVVAGTLVGAAGPDLHLEVRRGQGSGGVVVVDGRVLSGWRLEAVEGAAEVTVPVRGIPAVQGGLF